MTTANGTNGTALAHIDDVAMATRETTRAAVLTKAILAEQAEQRHLLSEYVRGQMREGVDFGTIPGTPKPTLLKPGAEKLVELFRCTPRFKLMKCVEDFDRGFFSYVFRVQLFQRDAGAVVAEGYGSANSYEGRYRWRESQRKCPKCGKEAIIKGKPEYGGGWLCFGKKGGCGAKFKENDATITGQVTGRVENDDLPTYANTVLKMAKKRALVDGSIALGRCSDMFTQDVEDFSHHDEPAPAPAATPPKNERAPQARRGQTVRTTATRAEEPPPPGDDDAPPVVGDESPGEAPSGMAADLLDDMPNIGGQVAIRQCANLVTAAVKRGDVAPADLRAVFAALLSRCATPSEANDCAGLVINQLKATIDESVLRPLHDDYRAARAALSKAGA